MDGRVRSGTPGHHPCFPRSLSLSMVAALSAPSDYLFAVSAALSLRVAATVLTSVPRHFPRAFIRW